MRREDIEIKECCWHRNGISGLGFYAIRFMHDGLTNGNQMEFLATVFDEPGACAVICLDMLDDCGVEFAAGNSWRGDVFESVLRECIAEGTTSGARYGPFGI